jgi:hypothetical protein
VTLAGTAVATFAAALLITGLTGGCGSTDTAHLDRPRAVVQPATAGPQPVLRIGDSVTWGSP